MTAGEGPATRACVDGDLDQLNALLNGLSEPLDELSTIDLHTALNIAVEKDDILAVDSLLKYATPTKYNLCDAIKNRSHYTVELLLQNGCNINEEIRSNCPPPLSLVLSDPEFVQWLIEHGADPNASCYFDITPLSAAAQSASKEVIELLFKLGASVDRGQPLHFAVMNGRPDDIVTLFLEKGAAINARMYESHERSFVLLKGLGLATPLHEAAKAKNIRLVQLLQENGADPKIPDTLGRLPQFEI